MHVRLNLNVRCRQSARDRLTRSIRIAVDHHVLDGRGESAGWRRAGGIVRTHRSVLGSAANRGLKIVVDVESVSELKGTREQRNQNARGEGEFEQSTSLS